MANSKLKSSTEEREFPKEEHADFESENVFCITDDSDEDPTFDIIEETQTRFSKISIKKSRKVKELDSESEEDEDLDSFGVEIPELNEKDGKCFEKVEELIRDGQCAKLKIEQCKVYLRKYGLRLTGNKGILIERIQEHLEVGNGGGEKKYPLSSFMLNCKGDACTGDVVMFEQNVYEMFNIASRSASGPPCGTRVVAGRIVKESYGAAKQQHTFTIEVLWSKGEKPLPPLHPLLIKGRNLYRLKTLRQRWGDEEERRRVIQEKHSRGFVARCSRETRIKEKEAKKIRVVKRTESKINQKEPVHNVVLQPQGNPVQVTHEHGQFHQQKMVPNVPGPVQYHARQILHHQKENVPTVQANNWPGYPHYMHISQPHEVHHRQPPVRQWCRYYRQGRCHFGDNCKYLHE